MLFFNLDFVPASALIADTSWIPCVNFYADLDGRSQPTQQQRDDAQIEIDRYAAAANLDVEAWTKPWPPALSYKLKTFLRSPEYSQFLLNWPLGETLRGKGERRITRIGSNDLNIIGIFIISRTGR